MFIPGISTFYQPASNLINTIADLAGAEWGVRHDTNQFYLQYPKKETSDATLVLKSMPDYATGRDIPETTSYILKGRTNQIGLTMRKEDGFANKLFAFAASKRRVDSSSVNSSGSTSLSNTAVAQQVKAGSTQLRDLAFTLSKIGSVEHIGRFVDGRICHDSSFDFPAENKIIADFQIDVNDIPLNPGPVYKLNLAFNEKVNPGDYYWIILYQFGDEPNQSSYVSWHHDDLTDIETKQLASAVRIPGAKVVDPSNPQTWTVSRDGPTYSYGAFYVSNHIVSASDPFSIRRWGEVDDLVANTNIKDSQTMVQYLYTQLAWTAKPKIIYPTITASIPLNGFFQPGQLVQIIDNKSGNTADKMTLAELVSVRYVWDARATGENQHAEGINSAEISLIGYYNYLDELNELK